MWASEPAIRNADLLLLSELDVGMARSENRHVAADLADALGLCFAFVPTFRELTPGNAFERRVTSGREDEKSLHGIAILSRLPIRRARAVKLPDVYDWSTNAEKREGGRGALIVELEDAAGGPLSAVCTHLECHTEPAGRALQLRAAVESLPGGRCLLGGDFNSSTAHHSSVASIARLLARLALRPTRLTNPISEEPLFEYAARAGFSHRGTYIPGTGTGAPHGLGAVPLCFRPHVDWILLRDLEPVEGSARLFPAPRDPRARGRRRLSVHDGVGVTVRLV